MSGTTQEEVVVLNADKYRTDMQLSLDGFQELEVILSHIDAMMLDAPLGKKVKEEERMVYRFTLEGVASSQVISALASKLKGHKMRILVVPIVGGDFAEITNDKLKKLLE